MEDVLAVYHLPYNPKRPVICLDELPFQLLGEKIEPLPMKEGKEKKFDSEYIRNGVASVIIVVFNKQWSKNGAKPKLLLRCKTI
jgi:hypothetical protein